MLECNEEVYGIAEARATPRITYMVWYGMVWYYITLIGLSMLGPRIIIVVCTLVPSSFVAIVVSRICCFKLKQSKAKSSQVG